MPKAGKLTTYDPKKILIACGTHTVTGYDEDNFVSVESSGDGITKITGCDGEIVRNIDPDHGSVVKITVLYGSDSNAFFQEQYNRDLETGEAIFPLMIQDLMGGYLFSAEQAWVAKPASKGFGKQGPNREWEIHTGESYQEG